MATASAAAPEGSRAPATIPRPRVTALLSAAWQRRVTLVVAGAGYGKTTALGGVAAACTSRWVRVRPADGQAESLAARIAAALGEAPPPGGSALADATGSDDRRVLAERRAALLCDLAEARHDSRSDDLLLVIDGVEHLGRDEAASHLLRVLALEAPPRLHLVLSGRSLPELGLGGSQGRGEVLEVTAPDLCFTAEETASLIRARLGEQSLALAQDCWSLTGGWAAALQLLLDRLERLDPAGHARALDRLRRSRGQLWQAFARDLVSAEDTPTRKVLAVAAVAPRVDAGLLNGIGVPAAPGDLESLWERGLLVEAGDPGHYRLSPVLAEAGAAAGEERSEIRQRAASWLERHGRLEEALECHAASDADAGGADVAGDTDLAGDTDVAGDMSAARAFFARCGPALIRGGAAARLIEVLRSRGGGSDQALDVVLAEAWQAVGEWDAAIDLFARVERANSAEGLPPGTAWRYGVLLYMRGEPAAAASILARAHDPARTGADDAMVSAWLSTAHWAQGQTDAAAQAGDVALRQASATGDACALAAAHVSLALVAASRGERERNEQEYRLALVAARQGGDRVQLSRIHANLSSRAVENGAYAQAVTEAERALETGAGHGYFSALALVNKAEAHLHLGQLDAARAVLTEAATIHAALGALYPLTFQVLSGELYRQRGDAIRARMAFERARAVADTSGDAHTLAKALSGLARVLAEDDAVAARPVAAEAVAAASSLERAYALCTAAEVELRAGNHAAAEGFARQAEADARATDDRPVLAESLELQGAARVPGDRARIEAALELWDDVGNPVGAARARLALAVLSGDDQAAAQTRQYLAALGVDPAIGVPGLLAIEPASQAAGSGAGQALVPELAIVALGRFAVLRAGETVPLAAWQSRKARDLLKLLVARQGRPITREAAAEAMWPQEDPEPLGNRLSVALSTIRKVLDPDRGHPPDHYVMADARAIALRPEHVGVDLIEFLRVADQATDVMAHGRTDEAQQLLRRAREIYAGDFLEEDLYEDWAVEAREEARSRLFTVLRLLARLSADKGDDETAGQYLGQLVEREPYDEDAWLALIAGQLRLRRHGEAHRRYAAYARRMGELGVVPVPLADAAGWRP